MKKQVNNDNNQIANNMFSDIKNKLNLNYKVDHILHLKKEDYIRAVPIIIEWIPQFPSYSSREGLIRLLNSPYVKDKVCDFLMQEFNNPENKNQLNYKWAIGNNLERFASDDIADDLIALAAEKEHGSARQMIVLGLGKIKNSEKKKKAINILIKLLNDENVVGHAISALGKLKATEARSFIEKFLEYTGKDQRKLYWKREAKKAIKRIDKNI